MEGEAPAEPYAQGSAGASPSRAGASPSTSPLHPLAVRVMKEIGINIRAYRSKHIREFLGKKPFSYLITFGDQEDRVTFTGFTECVHWVVEDPVAFRGDEAARLEKFRRVRDQVGMRIQEWLENYNGL